MPLHETVWLYIRSLRHSCFKFRENTSLTLNAGEHSYHTWRGMPWITQALDISQTEYWRTFRLTYHLQVLRGHSLLEFVGNATTLLQQHSQQTLYRLLCFRFFSVAWAWKWLLLVLHGEQKDCKWTCGLCATCFHKAVMPPPYRLNLQCIAGKCKRVQILFIWQPLLDEMRFYCHRSAEISPWRRICSCNEDCAYNDHFSGYKHKFRELYEFVNTLEPIK